MIAEACCLGLAGLGCLATNKNAGFSWSLYSHVEVVGGYPRRSGGRGRLLLTAFDRRGEKHVLASAPAKMLLFTFPQHGVSLHWEPHSCVGVTRLSISLLWGSPFPPATLQRLLARGSTWTPCSYPAPAACLIQSLPQITPTAETCSPEDPKSRDMPGRTTRGEGTRNSQPNLPSATTSPFSFLPSSILSFTPEHQ